MDPVSTGSQPTWFQARLRESVPAYRCRIRGPRPDEDGMIRAGVKPGGLVHRAP